MNVTEQATTRDEALPRDPLTSKSYAPHFLVAVLTLIIATILALVDEVLWRRPWKQYQEQFFTLAREKYEADLAQAEAFLRDLRSHPEYLRLLMRLALEEEKYGPDGSSDGSRSCPERSRRAARLLQEAQATLADLPGRIDELEQELEELCRQLADAADEGERARLESRHVELQKELDDFRQRLRETPAVLAEMVAGVEAVRETGLKNQQRRAELKEERQRLQHRMGELQLDHRRRRNDLDSRRLELEELVHERQNLKAEQLLDLLSRQEAPDLKRCREQARQLEEAAVRQLMLSVLQLKENFDTIDREITTCRNRLQQLRDEETTLALPRQEAERKLGAFIAMQHQARHLSSAEQTARALKALEEASIELRQIHNPELGLLDRCLSCHLATTQKGFEEFVKSPSTAPLGAEAVEEQPLPDGRVLLNLRPPFRSHPDVFTPVDGLDGEATILQVHPVDTFGCTPCHRGQGYATSSVASAHGEVEYWDWPLRRGRSTDSSCYACHRQQEELPGAPHLSRGRFLFRRYGCWGCHEVEDYEDQRARLAELEALARKYDDMARRATEEQDPLALAYLDKQPGDEREELRREIESLRAEARMIAPDLQNDVTSVAQKVYPEWLPGWLQRPMNFRPATRMPNFMFSEAEALQVAAFLWRHSGPPDSVPEAPDYRDDDPKVLVGEHLFQRIGCLGCHQANVHVQPKNSTRRYRMKLGSDFAPALGRVGEKLREDWLVEWLLDPGSLQPHATMPNMRLAPEPSEPMPRAWAERLGRRRVGELEPETASLMARERAEAIAAFLATQRRKRPAPAPAVRELLLDPALAREGKILVERYGCYSCHRLRDLERRSRIGSDLTAVGAKRIERFPFGLVEEEIIGEEGVGSLLALDPAAIPPHQSSLRSPRENVHLARRLWFAQKLLAPRIFDQGRMLRPSDRLRMPWFEQLRPDQLLDLGVFLIGLDGASYPGQYCHEPAGRHRNLLEGEKLIVKYNCAGCHQLSLETLALKNGAILRGKTLTGSPSPRAFFFELWLPGPAPADPEAPLPGGSRVVIDRDTIAYRIPAQGGELNAFLGQGGPFPEPVDELGRKVYDGDVPDAETRAAGYAGLFPEDTISYLPTVLHDLGERVRGDWLFAYLKEPRELRPLPEAHMPDFGLSDREAETLARYFAARNQVRYPFELVSESTKEYMQQRLRAQPDLLARTGRLFRAEAEQQCLDCHLIGGQTRGYPRGPDLMNVQERIRPEWLSKFLRHPRGVLPGTLMPRFEWTSPAYQEAFPGSAEERVRALRDLLLHLRREWIEKWVRGE